MSEVVRIGLDTAKLVFELHGVDVHGSVVLRRTVRRKDLLSTFAQLPRCLVGLESCAGSHHWARALQMLGHDARLMASQFVSAYRKEQKNDANDAAALCEAVGRPSMRFVPVKSVEQQAVLTLHRARELAVQQRTALINQIRGLLGEFGLSVGKGTAALRSALPALLEDAENGLPSLARAVIAELRQQWQVGDSRIADYDRRIASLASESEPAKRLMHIPGIGPVTATAIVASVGGAEVFRSARQFAAWLGLTPRQHSSGGKSRLGSISKRGDVYLRTLLIHGTRSVLSRCDARADRLGKWMREVRQRRGRNIAAVALAAKHARIVWAVLRRDCAYVPA